MTTALIDADILLYSIGFSIDKTYYKVGRKKCKYKKDAKKWCDIHGIDYNEIIKHHEAGDLDEGIKTIDETIEGILDATSSSKGRLFLTGKNNFRYDVATTVPYKGNRDRDHKPHHMQALREYMIEEWKAEETEGIEADDALGINQTEDTIICTIDKDLMMIPGWNYNWNKREFTEVSEREAWIHFYRQMLTGDRADNIVSIYPDTPTNARQLSHLLSYFDNEREMKCYVGGRYAQHFDDPEARMLENGKLLWIMRKENDYYEL